MALDIRTASLIDFLPESIAQDPDIRALSLAVDPELREISNAIVEAIILPRISELPEELLDELAWMTNLQNLAVWDDAPVAGKRALLVGVFDVLRRAGTRSSVQRIFELIGITAAITEWWEEPDGLGAGPHTYRLFLFVSEAGLTEWQAAHVGELLHRFAPVRAKLHELAAVVEAGGTLTLIPALTLGRITEISYGG